MKKFVLVCLLALPIMAATQQKASAWFKFSAGGSFHINLTGGGVNFHYRSDPPPAPCLPYGAYPHVPHNGYPVAQPDQKAAYQYQAQNPVRAVDYQSMWYYNNAGYQPVGYYYPSAGYGYYQAPSYWYGR